MTALLKKFLSLSAVSLFTIFNVESQKILTVDFCMVDPDTPILMFDTIKIFVHNIVDDTSATDDNTLFGDLYYWYQTDSMVAAGVPPRLINNDLTSESIPNGGKFDTVLVDIRPDEIRTNLSGHVNVLCLWTAMQLTSVEDTVPCCGNYIFGGFSGIENTSQNTYNVIFPNPTEEFIFLKQSEILLIDAISILSMEGQIVSLLNKEDFKNGVIPIEYLERGCYIIEIIYADSTIVRTKIIKR